MVSRLKKHAKGIIKGVTLIELVTAIAILGMVAVMVVSIYFAHFKLFSNQSRTIDLANENRLALDDMTNQIREADAVVANCPASAPYSGCGGDTTSSSVLVLEIWPVDVNGDPMDPGTSNFDYIIYRRDTLENTKLVKKTFPSSISARPSGSQIISSDVSNLSFTYNNADPTLATEVTVDLANTLNEFGKTFNQSGETQAVLRNK